MLRAREASHAGAKRPLAVEGRVVARELHIPHAKIDALYMLQIYTLDMLKINMLKIYSRHTKIDTLDMLKLMPDWACFPNCPIGRGNP